MKRLFDEISNKVDMLASVYKSVLQREVLCRSEEQLAKKLLIIKEAASAINTMKSINEWAEINLKGKGSVFHNNYISINYQYRVYMENIFKCAVENENTIFAKALIEKNNKLIDFNGKDCFNHCPINIAIRLKNKAVFDYLIKNSKANNRGLIVNFSSDSSENKARYEKVRTIYRGKFAFEASPLFTALSLFEKTNNNCQLSHFVNSVVLNEGTDLPDVLYRDVPEMKNVIDLVEVYRLGIQEGFDKCKYSDVKNIVPVVSQNMDLGPKLAFGLKIEDRAPENYVPVKEFEEITIYDDGQFDNED